LRLTAGPRSRRHPRRHCPMVLRVHWLRSEILAARRRCPPDPQDRRCHCCRCPDCRPHQLRLLPRLPHRCHPRHWPNLHRLRCWFQLRIHQPRRRVQRSAMQSARPQQSRMLSWRVSLRLLGDPGALKPTMASADGPRARARRGTCRTHSHGAEQQRPPRPKPGAPSLPIVQN
jgi:hypothetical protein